MLDLTTSIDDFDGYTQVHCTIMTDPQQIAKPRQVVNCSIEVPYSDSLKEVRLAAFLELKNFLTLSLSQIDGEIARLQQ